VPVGELQINGSSSDNQDTNCLVYVDWNDLKPMQNVTPNGPGGENDYSTWTFKYTKDYHLIAEGSNELTSKITCSATATSGNATSTTKFNSLNVTGVGLDLPASSPSYGSGDPNGTLVKVVSSPLPQFSNTTVNDSASWTNGSVFSNLSQLSVHSSDGNIDEKDDDKGDDHNNDDSSNGNHGDRDDDGDGNANEEEDHDDNGDSSRNEDDEDDGSQGGDNNDDNDRKDNGGDDKGKKHDSKGGRDHDKGDKGKDKQSSGKGSKGKGSKEK
jgi:hypothetical protein